MLDELALFLKTLVGDIIAVITYVPLLILDTVMGGISSAIVAIPAPAFITATSIGDYITDDVAWMLAMSGFPEALAIVGAGMTFRFSRRVLTLGIW